MGISDETFIARSTERSLGTVDDHAQLRRKPATLRAVAAEAGVSTATASKALNGITVSALNLERVHAAAEALGYAPNVTARSFRGPRTMTIGIVMNFDTHPATEFMTLVDRAITEMEDNGYSVLLSRPRSAGVDSVLRRMFERRVDGLFYWNAQPADSLDLYRDAGIPVLAVAYKSPGCPDLPLISADSRPAYRQLFALLRKLGHDRVNDLSHFTSSEAHRAVAESQKLIYQHVDLGFDRDKVREFIESLSKPDGPTALLAPFPSALQLLSAFGDLGIAVPEQVSLISLMDSEAAALLRIPLTAMRTDYDALGRASAKAMLEALAGGIMDDTFLPDIVELVERSSVGPAASGAQRPRGM